MTMFTTFNLTGLEGFDEVCSSMPSIRRSGVAVGRSVRRQEPSPAASCVCGSTNLPLRYRHPSDSTIARCSVVCHGG